MFVGHYSVAFALKSEKNKIPLWVLFVAVQFFDYIWATLVLLGIEKLRVIKGFTAGSMLDWYFHPYSHSLITAILWSCVAAILYKPICSWLGFVYTKSAALIIGIAVFSHWILDVIAHPAISRSTTIRGRWVLVCGIIATRSLHWKWRCLRPGSCYMWRETRCRQSVKER